MIIINVPSTDAMNFLERFFKRGYKTDLKAMIVAGALQNSLPIVAASGLGGYGDSDRITGRRIGRRLFLIGDGRSEVSDALPPWSPVVGIAAAKQADAVIEWILHGNWGAENGDGAST